MHMLLASKLGALAVAAADLSRAAAGDLSHSAAAMLLTLHYHGPTTASALAAVAGVTQPTAVRVVAGLAAQSLVERAGRSGKTAPFRLTAAGSTRAVALQAARLSALQRLLADLDTDQQAVLERLLDRMLAGATTSRRAARTICRLCDHALCDGPVCPAGRRATEIEDLDRREAGRERC